MDALEGLALVFERNAFYRRQYLLVVLVFVLSIVVNIVLCWMLYYVSNNPTKPLFFAANSVGRLIDVIPLNQPNMTTEEVAKWTVSAVEDISSFDFVNYRSQLQASQKYFTSYGWDNYVKALTASNNLVAVQQRKMIAIANVIDTPVLMKQGLIGGTYYGWRFQLPLLVTYWMPPFDENSKYSNALQVTVIVQRQSILQSYKGLGITQLILSRPTAVDSTQSQITASPAG